jgi:predicted dehydrogenase
MSKVRWAVVGTSGFALDWIARGVALGSNAELAAVVSRDAARAQAAATRVGAPHSFTSIEAIDTSLVDGVFLVVPNLQHAPLAISAASRGLHVIVEKPMAPTLAECQAMVKAAHANKVVLAVAHCMEWAPPIVKARELLAENAIGTIIGATIAGSFNSPPSGGWRQNDTIDAGGGPLFDMGVHVIDAITRLLGPIEQVSAQIDRRLYDYAADDIATLLVRFASGAHGLVESHFTCHQNALHIQGTAGRIWSDTWWGRDFAGDLHLRRGDEEISFELPRVNVYVPQIEHISDAVLSSTAPLISGERGLANVAVIRAAIEAGRTGRAQQI